MPYKDKKKRCEHDRAYRARNRELFKERDKKYREAHREKIRQVSNDWAENNPLVVKNYILKRRYGIAINEYNKLFENQKGCCAICGEHQSKFKKALHVDHCHESNKIRGLLCVHCNTTLGHFREDVGLLIKIVNKDNVILNADGKKGLTKFCSDVNNLHAAINYLSVA